MNEIIKKNGIKFGVISGLFSAFYIISMYIVDYKLFINIWLGVAVMLVFLAIGIFQLNELRKNLGGFMTFKEGFTGYFIAALIGILISTSFSIILFNLIDTTTRDLIHEALITFQVENLQKWNVPASEIKKAVNSMKETPQFSTLGLLYGVLKSLLGSIVFGLILAAIFKKNQPVF
ncbi:50S ribosomal protein L31 type B [Flavobacteria bacterium BAL38]|nr:50S ribosomal protein L31 type B [Flavobacteria bacterium BAL38]